MSALESLKKETWFQILQDEVCKTSISDVARKIGYKRPTVSLVLSGNYNGGTQKVAAAVIAAFTDRVSCPYLESDITVGECSDYQSRSMPTSNPSELRHWTTCRSGCLYCSQAMEDNLHA